MASGEILQIDGSVLEGGGQIVRIASSLSCILKRPITINGIRAGRKSSGLKAQHLASLELLTELSKGKSENLELGSNVMTLCPDELEGGSFVKDIKTAGSVCLMVQSALPVMLFSKKMCQLRLKGGTNASMAPPIDYFIKVLHPTLQKMGINFQCQLHSRGFFPKGGGEISLKCDPIKHIQPITLLKRGSVIRITGLSFVAGVLPKMLADVMKSKSESLLTNYFKKSCPPIKPNLTRPHPYNRPTDPDLPKISILSVKDNNAFGNGSGIILVAETDTGLYLASSSLGTRGLDPEVVATKACDELFTTLNSASCVDEYMQDQLIIFMALAKGVSRVRTSELTLHSKTAIHVVQLLTSAKFTFEECEDNTTIITCEGCAYENKYLV